MKFFTSKSVMKKLIIAIIFVVLINFTFAPTISHANLGEDITNIFLDLFLRIGDGIMYLMHKVVYGWDSCMYKIIRADAGIPLWKKILGVLAVIVVAAAWVLGTILTGGALAIVTAVGVVAAIGGAAIGISMATDVYNMEMGKVPPTLYLPSYLLSPQEIFSNGVPMLDVNFFSPMGLNTTKAEFETNDGEYGIWGPVDVPVDPTNASGPTKEAYFYKTPVKDSSGKQLTYQVDNPSTALQLRPLIAKWYNSLRTLALIGLLTVLVYVAIRIILSSTANEKAKYKTMIQGWATAICLLFVLHYIMAFSIGIVQRVSSAIARGDVGRVQYAINDEETISYINGTKEGMTDAEKEEVAPLQALISDGALQWNTNLLGAARMDSQWLSVYDTGSAVLDVNDSNIDTDSTLWTKAAYTLIYLVLVFFTIYYTLYYLKRILYLGFLTLIAPLITLTYPLDKINDGQAQAFNYWLKEYMYNLIIQPFHLIIYTVFVVSAFDFASKNFLYVIVVLWFITSAEKILRKMFRFEADTNKQMNPMALGAIGGIAGSALKKLAVGGGKKQGGQSGGGSDGEVQQRAAPRISGTSGWDELNGGGNAGGGNAGDGGNAGGDLGDGDADDGPPLGEPPPETPDLYDDPDVMNYMDSPEYQEWLEERDDGKEQEIQEYEDYLNSDDYIGDRELDAMAEEEERAAFLAEMEEIERAEQEQIETAQAAEAQAEEETTPQGEEDGGEVQQAVQQQRERLVDRMRKHALGRFALGAGNVAVRRTAALKRPLAGVVKGAFIASAGITMAGLEFSRSIAQGEQLGKIAQDTIAAGGMGAGVAAVTTNIAKGIPGFIAGGASDIREEYNQGAYGTQDARREADIRKIGQTQTVRNMIDRYAEALDVSTTEEKRAMAQKFGEYSVDTGSTNFNQIRKGIMMELDGTLSEVQAKNVVQEASGLDRGTVLKELPKIKETMKAQIIEAINKRYEGQEIDEEETERTAEEFADQKAKALRRIFDL